MTDMRKRLEKAVRDCAFLAGVDLSAGGVTIEDRIVNVILSALEEPSEAMIEAGTARMGQAFLHGAPHAIVAQHTFAAMIKAAKGEE